MPPKKSVQLAIGPLIAQIKERMEALKVGQGSQEADWKAGWEAENKFALSQLFPNRVLTYIVLFVGLCLAYFFLRGSSWQGSTQLHTLMETVAFLLALMVGVMALSRFYARKNNTFLFIGAAFVGTALLDGYHAAVTSSYFASHFPSAPASLFPWSWIASRWFLSVLLFLSWLACIREDRHGEAGRIRERTVYCSVGLLTLSSFIFFAFVPLPRAYYPEIIFHRPEEFLPAAFFLLALCGFLYQGRWKTHSFKHWLVISLIVGVVSQTVFMSFSGQLFDMEFDAAHLLKKVSYVCVLTGLVISMYHLFKQEEERTDQLGAEIAERAHYEVALEEAMDELQKSQSQLVHAEKMSALGTLVAGVAHELNNPMMGILNFAQYCSRHTPEDDHRYEVLLDIERETKRCSAIVENLLTFSHAERISEESLQEGDCSSLCQRAVNLLAYRIDREGVSVKQESITELPLVLMHENQIQQVFLNILANALDALKETGKEQPEVRISIGFEGGIVGVTIADNGPGIDPGTLPKVFDPFFTTKPTGQGTGLGLSVSRSIVAAHGGEITCDSEFGLGTQFRITLPV